MHYGDLLFIILLGFVPLLWFSDGCLIAGSDFSAFLDPVTFSSHYLYPWTMTGLGGPNITVSITVPLYLYFGLLKHMGIDPVLSQKIWLVFFFMLAGLSMRYLIRTIAMGLRADSRVISAVSAAMYMVNFYMVNSKMPILAINGLYACTPLVMAFLYRMIVLRNNRFRYAILTALSSVLFLPGFANPPGIAVFVLIQSLFIAFLFLVEKNAIDWFKSLKYVLISLSVFVLINVWWILPFVDLMFKYKGYGGYQHVYWNPGSFLKDIIALSGCWSWGDYYYPITYPVYQNVVFKYILYLIPFMAFAAILINGPYKKYCYFFLMLSFVGLFFSKGRGGLFGGLFEYLFDHCPGFWMFREPYAKFGVVTVLGYAVLAGIFVQGIFEKAREAYGKLLVSIPLIGILVILFAAWPVFTRYFMEQSDRDYLSVFAKAPDYWKKAAEHVNTQTGEFRLFEMPDNRSSYTMLGWGHGFSGSTPEQCFFTKPAVTGSYFPLPIVQYYYDMLWGSSEGINTRIFTLLNITYVYQRNDMIWQYYDSLPPVRVKSLLEKQMGLAKERSVGSIDFYPTGNDPRLVYLKDSVDFVCGGLHAVPMLAHSAFMDDPALIFWGQQSETEDMNGLACSKRVVFAQEDPDEWVMRLFPSSNKVNPELMLSRNDWDFRKSWIAVKNFYVGEWVDKEDRKYVNGDFFEGSGAVFTQSETPLDMTWDAPRDDEYVIGVRSYASATKGAFVLGINSGEMRYDAQSNDTPRVRWFLAKKKLSRGAHKVFLRNAGARAIVDSLVFYTDEDKQDVLKKAKRLIEGKDVTMLFMLDGVHTPVREFRVLQEGVYAVNVCSSAGKKIQYYIDNRSFETTPSADQSLQVNMLRLEEGIHTVRLGSRDSRVVLKLSKESPENAPVYKRVALKRYGPSRLLIEPFTTDRPMTLIFNELFNEGWKAYEIGEDKAFRTGFLCFMNCLHLRKSYKEIQKHSMINGYANAFSIPSGGTYRILLEFDPQNSFEKGILASITAGLLCFLYIVCSCLRKRNA